jgi:hypothetical protein
MRVPAAIEPQQHLLATREPLGDGGAQRQREHAGPTALAAQVHDAHDGQRSPIDARRQRQAPIPATRRVRERLETRRRRTQHDGDAEHLRASHRDVAAVVAQLLALLVRGLMLLVDDDELGVRQRREHGRARAHDDVECAAAREFPVAPPRADRQIAVQRADAPTESLLEHCHDLRRERDLGHEDERLPARLARGSRRAQIDLGLAARGDTVQQERLEAARADRLVDRDARLALRRRERDALGIGMRSTRSSSACRRASERASPSLPPGSAAATTSPGGAR